MKKLFSICLGLLIVMGSMAVLKAADAGDYLPASTWEITVNSDRGGTVRYMIDGRATSYWHSAYQAENDTIISHDEPPFEVVVTFPNEKNIAGIRYLPRQISASDNSSAGIVTKLSVYASQDGTNFTLVKNDSYTYAGATDRAERTTLFDTVRAKAMKVVFTEGMSGYGTCAELTFVKSSPDDPDDEKAVMASSIHEAKAQGIRPVGEAASDAFEYSATWNITASSCFTSSAVANMFDRDIGTYWHSWYSYDGTKIDEKDEPPFDITVKFPYAKRVSGVRYTPRQDDNRSGTVSQIEIFGSADGTNFTSLKRDIYTYIGADKTSRTTRFEEQELKAVKVRFLDGYGGYGTCAELEILKGDDAQAVDLTDDRAMASEHLMSTVTLTIDSYEADNDGIPMRLVAPAVISEGRTMVPIRFVSEALGAEVEWNPEERKVGIIKNDTTIFLTINSNKATINGKSCLLEAPAGLMNDSTMVPIRFVSEALGAEVEWMEASRQVLISYRKSIALWGDGLASSVGSLTEELEKNLYDYSGGITVNAYGVENENALTIAARQGAYDIVLAEDVTLSKTGGTEVKIALSDGRAIVPRSGLGGWNPCIIGSVSGILTFEVDYTTSPRTLLATRFIRSSNGEEVTLAAGTSVLPAASSKKADINVFMLASSRISRESPEELVQILSDMIEHTPNKTKYIVVTPLEGTVEELLPYEEAYRKAFGDKVLNIREAFTAEDTLRDHDVLPEEGEENVVARAFLRGKHDRAHLNDLGYSALSKLLYQKMIELGYAR